MPPDLPARVAERDAHAGPDHKAQYYLHRTSPPPPCADRRVYFAHVNGLFGLQEPLAPLKRDIKRTVRAPQQLGHFASALLAETLRSRPNLCPQSLHLYSYIGISASRSHRVP